MPIFIQAGYSGIVLLSPKGLGPFGQPVWWMIGITVAYKYKPLGWNVTFVVPPVLIPGGYIPGQATITVPSTYPATPPGISLYLADSNGENYGTEAPFGVLSGSSSCLEQSSCCAGTSDCGDCGKSPAAEPDTGGNLNARAGSLFGVSSYSGSPSSPGKPPNYCYSGCGS
jgi:hypothetical protein